MSVSKARAFVSAHLAEHDLSPLTDDVRLVASELATNAVQHARTPFTLSLQGAAQTVLLAVRDGAPATNVRVPDRPHLESGGRGLSIVQQVSKNWGVTPIADRAKSVWASFEL